MAQSALCTYTHEEYTVSHLHNNHSAAKFIIAHSIIVYALRGKNHAPRTLLSPLCGQNRLAAVSVNDIVCERKQAPVRRGTQAKVITHSWLRKK
jgi:hypothetical protein